MRTLNSYLSEYSESHRHERNIRLHNICVPAIMWSLLALLSLVPLISAETAPGGVLHAELTMAHLVVISALIYYSFFRQLRLWLVMAAISIAMLYTAELIPAPARLWISAVVFAAAWIGQFYGHKIEGKKPSFLKDLQFLLIGPLWVLQKIRPGWFA